MMLNPMERLRALVDSASVDNKMLPLIHITDAYGFSEISSGRTLVPQQCDVFGKEITYMFYGRPAYRTKHDGNIFLTANLPVVFLFHPERLLSLVKDIYPFDTGAFKLGLYSRFFHRRSDIPHFSLAGMEHASQKLVGYFYRDSEEYYYGSTRKNVDIPPFNFEAEGLLELYRSPADPGSPSKIKLDERTSSIELHFDHEIDLKDCLLGAIIPRPLFEHQEIKEFLLQTKPSHVKLYRPINKHDKSELAGEIYRIVEGIYQSEGLISQSESLNSGDTQ